MVNFDYLTYCQAEIILLIGLLGMLFLARRDSQQVFSTYIIYLASLLLAAFSAWNSQNLVWVEGPLLFNKDLVFVKVLGLLYSSLCGYLIIRERQDYPQEALILTLCSLIGFSGIIHSKDFLWLFVSIELLTFPLYTMVAFSDHPWRKEAAFKYFLQGSLVSTCFLFAVSFYYALTGTLELTSFSHIMMLPTWDQYPIKLIGIGLLALIAFKLGLAPFHFWVADVYQTALPSFLAYLSFIPKMAFFILAHRLINTGIFSSLYLISGEILTGIILASMVIAYFSALAQSDLRRFIGYASIGQLAFLPVALINTSHPNSFAIGVFYLFIYGLMSLMSFLILLKCREYKIQDIDQLKSFAYLDPQSAFFLTIAFLGFAGLPPFAGFFAKLFMLDLLVQQGSHQLALFVLLVSVVGCYYYLNLIGKMYFEPQSSSQQSFVQKFSVDDVFLIIVGSFFVIVSVQPDWIFNLILHSSL